MTLFHTLGASLALVITSIAVSRQPPEPKDAITEILNAYSRYDVVGLNAAHSDRSQDDFVLALIRQPRFASTVNDIVVECGNRRFQSILDRFIAGDDIPIDRVRPVWRDATVLMCGLSGFYDSFFSIVRDLNRSLPADRKLRVLAGDPPFDWSVGASARGADRDGSIAEVMTNEVLAKHRKALMLFGVEHLFHGTNSAVGRYESKYPGKTLVIDTHKGFAALFDLERGHQLEARMREWPTPSLIRLSGSWLADLDLPYFLWPFPKRMGGMSYAQLVDGYLYLGPGSALVYEPVPASVLDDVPYVAELSRRFGPLDVNALRQRASSPELFMAADRAEARQFAPGAECVGQYGLKAAGPVAAEIDFRKGQLSLKLPSSGDWITLASTTDRFHYKTADESGIEMSCRANGLAVSAIDVTQREATRTFLRLPAT